jgi:NAD(P)-dependent dehydrogenase (short-subunit alcohol dehydrogenase family)
MSEKTVVIFGATGGVGSELAKVLTNRGSSVILCSRNEAKLKEISSNLSQKYYVVDGTKEEDVESFFSELSHQSIKIDGVVNCIGSFCIKPLQATSGKIWEEVIKTNLGSSFYILKHGLKTMEQQKEGSIVLISSGAAKIGLTHHEAISAAKAGIEGLIRSAAASYGTSGIRINGVAPGLVKTPLSTSITENPEALKQSLKFHPLGRIGAPKDIALAIAWLLSDETSWISGEILSVDGGLSHLKTNM